ncbi:MAG: FGGY-family carbohydrate kinase [Chloroflexi bacterium]|nr:FGGY-family carbohydrate kinase [Chloroflexota bacterium]
MMEHVIGIDIGTTGTKAIALHVERGIVAEAVAPASLASPQPGWAEEDPREWWNNVGTVVRAGLERARLEPSQIAAVGVSGMVPTLILMDAKGEVIRPSIQQNDARSYREIDVFQSRFDPADVLARTGSAITQQSIGPKLYWLAQHEPDAMARARHVMGSYDYVVYCLTGEFSCERNWALESGLFDLGREDWDDAFLAFSRIDRTWLGQVRWPSEIAGRVTPGAAKQTGLAVGTPVVAGSADHIASAFSAGLKAPGDLLVKLGGAGDILFSLDEPLVDPRLFLDYHVIPGKYFVNGCMASSGSLIKWFRQQFAPDCDYATLDKEAAAVPAGSQGLILLPYFLGEKTPINDPLARGVLFGLTLSHTRAHVYRAVLEGISFGFNHHLEVLAERGLHAVRARVTNGGAQSHLWKQVTADILGVPLEQIAAHPGSSLGAAFVAGKGVGVFPEWSEIERFVSIHSVVEPDPGAHARYAELFKLYRSLYLDLKMDFGRLNEIAGSGS